MKQILINGEPASGIDPEDRGFLYGDGLFETMAVKEGQIPLWEAHWQRLMAGCEKLQLPLPTRDRLKSRIDKLIAKAPRAVLKLVLSRGKGERGYRIPAHQQPTEVLYLGPWPEYPQSWTETGIQLKICATPLGLNPALAGIKHLNRLENVLARNEWQDGPYQEGLMLDTRGNLVEGTMSNLFWVRGGTLFTPDLSDCGVLGIMRQQVLEKAGTAGIPTATSKTGRDTLEAADEIFMTNSLIGIWPVNMIDDRPWQVGPITQQLQKLIKT